MPGTTRYSATFDRTYDEDESSTAEPPVVARRSRSQSLQVDSLSDRKHLYSLAGSQDSHSRSSSTEKPPKGAEVIPTRTVGKPTVKPHNNPFQFVKIGTCPLYKKAEEQLQKVKEIKKPAVIKEDEEEWQSNLDSWKSRRRKMSEGTFRRQEELRRLEYEELLRSSQPQQQKKIKTFTEIVEERANRGRALSLCLFTNPLESGEWVFENTRSRRTSHDPLQVSEESAESSNINSEDDNDSFRKPEEGLNGSVVNDKMRGDDDQPEHHRNGVQTSTSNSSISKNSDLSEFDVSQESISHKDQSPGSICTDSGLESLSSSQRVGDIADSGSDFSQDSGSSIGCDSPRVSGLISSGVDLEEFSSNDELVKSTMISQKEKSPEKVTNGVHVSRTSASEVKDHPAKSTTDAKKTSKEKTKKVKKTAAKKTSTETAPVTKVEPKSKASFSPKEGEKNTESENEVSVDDFDRLAKLKTEESLRKTRAAEHSQLSSSVSSAQVSEVHANPSNHKTSKTSESNSVNVVYSSCPKNVSEKKSEPQNKGDSSLSQPQTNGNSNNFSLIGEVPVDKVTEEMERLILQQLEEEERAKEMEANAKSLITEVELPSKRVNPPQEKPPPPPITAAAAATTTTPVKKTSPKDTSVKRTNSTKRILKEIHKRRSDFLGIEETKGAADTSDDKAVHCPPTCADSVRTEQEGKSATSAAPEEEDEIARKEREIIENLETEERLKKNQSGSTLAQSLPLSTAASLDVEEEERIKRLKEELKRNEEERLLAEEQRMRLEEEKLLKLREQQIREQEAKDVQSQATTTTTAAASANETLSSNDNKVCEPVANEEKVSLLADGDGSIALTSSSASSAPSSAPLTAELSKPEEAAKPPPALAPRPLKKKEAIRRERERLRHEQEALQREREEHRRKVQMEQEQLKRSLQKAHVPGTPVCQVDTLSATTTTTTTATKPSLPPQLTPSLHKAHVHREASGQAVPPRTQNGLSEGAAVSGPFSPPKSKGSVQPKQIAGSSSRPRNAASETRTKPKVPLRKQAEPSGDSRYNQNHWLIQEAEMRRIAEQKERQHNQFHNDTRQNNPSFHSPVYADGYPNSAKPVQRPSALPLAQNSTNYAVPMQYSPDKSWNCAPPAHHNVQSRKCVPQGHINFDASQSPVVYSSNFDLSKSAPAKPSRSVPLEKQEHMLSVSGRKRCSHCGEELGRGAAMIIESLQLYYHIQCFQCCVCHAQLGNGSCGTDVRVRNNKLHCHNCYSNDEAGLKFSQV